MTIYGVMSGYWYESSTLDHMTACPWEAIATAIETAAEHSPYGFSILYRHDETGCHELLQIENGAIIALDGRTCDPIQVTS